MKISGRKRAIIVATSAVAVMAAGLAPTATAATTRTVTQAGMRTGTQAGTRATTPAEEARRVDRVPTPKLDWYPCGGNDCTTVRLPLDYDQPTGPTTELAVLRVRATDPKKKIGTLFLNPGGPGGSSTDIASQASFFLSKSVLERFDVVGVDPRGIGASDHVQCFPTVRAQALALVGLGSSSFPYTAKEESAYVGSSRAIGRACSSTGRPLAGAMSTAEVARDMDVMRRAVGDKKLTYLGFSYGTALGQYYANMFPGRVRSIVVDGVINPVNWVGSPATQGTSQDDRIRSADGSYRALHEVLVRCAKAGKVKCPFAAKGDPVANFELLTKRLKAKPVELDDGNGGTFRLTYADLIGNVLFSLYIPFFVEGIPSVADELLTATEPPAPGNAARRATAAKAAAKRLASWKAAARTARPSRDFPYDNGVDAFTGVTCTDGLHPKDAGLWPALGAQADRRAPYFGRAWDWGSAPCARKTWTVRDEDAYTGPFNRRTSSPVLFVGNFWDPATNYQEAVSSSKLLPGSRLLSSDSWGHTAYGTSACVTSAVDAYLLAGTLPKVGTLCKGDIQPFETSPPGARTRRSATSDQRRPAGTAAELPPVAIPAPVARGLR
jgi:pimeloyl-ACP methyl ester carboxylesterase